MVNESFDRELREQWQSQPEMEHRMSVDDVRSRVDAADARRRPSTVVLVACAATIIPTWLAVMWLVPDFRVMAAVGLFTAVWILAGFYRTSIARVTSAPLPAPPAWRSIGHCWSVSGRTTGRCQYGSSPRFF